MLNVPVTWHSEVEHRRRLADGVNRLIDGHGNGAGLVTITANQATTVVADKRCGADTVIVFMPKTTEAATEFAAGTMYISARGNGTFTITHVNSATADRDFSYALLGTGSQ